MGRFLLWWLFASAACAQSIGGGGAEPPVRMARNAIYVEGMGNGLLLSLNYDRRILDVFSVHVGAGFYLPDSGAYPNNHSVFVPTGVVLASYLMGSGSSKLEFGAGLAMQFVSLACELYSPPFSCTALKPTLLVGYRFQSRKPGVIFRAGFTPIWYGEGVYWGFGMSAGYSF